MLTNDELKIFKEKLDEEKKRVMSELDSLTKNLDFGSETDHLEEEADETEAIDNSLGVKKILEKRLESINQALDKIESGNGKYGVCENCGEAIESRLLEIDPESKLCRNCKLK